MAEYIERESLYKEVTEKYRDINGGCYPFNIVACDMAQLVKNAPAADVVEVVRCKDCKFWECGRRGSHCDHITSGLFSTPNDGTGFCSYGERKETE